MTRWAPHSYRREATFRGVSDDVADAALKQTNRLHDAGLPSVLTLGHFAFHTGIPYAFLRAAVSRRLPAAYRVFSIRKRSGGKRYINVPCPRLRLAQKWIDRFILPGIQVSPHSYAFDRGCSIVDCASQHLRCRWLVKVDLRDFFESLSEIQAYRVFHSAGYGKLISFQMARLCTNVLRADGKRYTMSHWRARGFSRIREYASTHLGHLPQGAPTSPKLANLIVRPLDREIASIAHERGLVYTRYADDITLSTASEYSRSQAQELVRSIYSMLPRYGLRPNPQKAQIIPPGARKIVLGLLVEGDRPRLSKRFRRKLECHMYYSAKDPVGHAQRRGFDSVLGLRNHIGGLLVFATHVDPQYAAKISEKHSPIEWPLQ